MNRDELLSRPPALPSATHRCGDLEALYPHELSGGTWIGLNENGLTFALINWYSQPQRSGPGTLSRGQIIPALLAAATSDEAERRLADLPIARINPFRLVMIASTEKRVREWRSSGTLLEATSLPWEKHHWFSSGFDEVEVNEIRALACRRASGQSDADTLPWLRRLHRSHHPVRGAFSLCMHRADARTVSSTEIVVSQSAAQMVHHEGPPCSRGPGSRNRLQLAAGHAKDAA